jgi:acyl carrier protein
VVAAPGRPTNTMSDALRTDIKQAIVRSLRLPMQPGEIGDDTPLFGEGLGLDSIDALELVLELERSFGVKITDEQTGAAVLRSVNTIAAYVEQSRGTASS